MKSTAQIGHAALSTWGYVMQANGEVDTPPEVRGIRTEGAHGNPVESAAIKALSRWDLRTASRVDGFLREYFIQPERDARMIVRALHERYVGPEEPVPYQRSVHGIAYRLSNRPAKNWHEVALRLNVTDRTARSLLWRGRTAVGRDMESARRVARGITGEVRTCITCQLAA